MNSKDSVKDHIIYIVRDLDLVESDLRSAKGWGFFDLLGGGSITSFIKHNKINKAEKHFRELLRKLQALKSELEDFNIFVDPNFNTSQLNQFLDIFMDNIFSDILTQSKINDSIRKVEDLRRYLARLHREL